MKSKYKEMAIALRKKGLSYGEILQKIHVSRSSLSLWLKSIPLAQKYKKRLYEKKLKSIAYGRTVWNKMRLDNTKIIRKNARIEISRLAKNKDSLWLMGIMLYWAEGAKEKEYNIGQGVWFSNQDSRMIQLYILWLKTCLKITSIDVAFDIYVHITNKERIESIKKYWAKNTGYSTLKFDKIYFKKHSVKSIRRNTQVSSYHGLLRVRVKRSTNLNRRIMGWIDGICEKWGVVQW